MHYVADLDEQTYYIPLGTISVEANWDNSESVNLLTLVKSAENYLRTQATGFDYVILASDILKRSISHQRSMDADGNSVAITPSISSALGQDGLTGSIFGWGSSSGTSRPHSRKGATFIAAAIMPGPWIGNRPRVSQKAYFMDSIALPKELNSKKIPELQSGPTTQVVKENTEAMTQLKSQVDGIGTVGARTVVNP